MNCHSGLELISSPERAVQPINAGNANCGWLILQFSPFFFVPSPRHPFLLSFFFLKSLIPLEYHEGCHARYYCVVCSPRLGGSCSPLVQLRRSHRHAGCHRRRDFCGLQGCWCHLCEGYLRLGVSSSARPLDEYELIKSAAILASGLVLSFARPSKSALALSHLRASRRTHTPPTLLVSLKRVAARARLARSLRPSQTTFPTARDQPSSSPGGGMSHGKYLFWLNADS